MSIVVCVNNNKESKKAVKSALRYSKKYDLDIVLIHSMIPQIKNINNPNGRLSKESFEEGMERGRDIVDKYIKYINKLDDTCEVSGEVLSTNNHNKIETVINYVDRNDVQHIFVGHRLLDSKKEKVMGSFAKDLVSYSPIPVTVVP